jgi:hypothetical protein
MHEPQNQPRSSINFACGEAGPRFDLRHYSPKTKRPNSSPKCMEAKPQVPEGAWYKDFGSFKLCGETRYPKTFLLAGQAAAGQKL